VDVSSIRWTGDLVERVALPHDLVQLAVLKSMHEARAWPAAFGEDEHFDIDNRVAHPFFRDGVVGSHPVGKGSIDPYVFWPAEGSPEVTLYFPAYDGDALPAGRSRGLVDAESEVELCRALCWVRDVLGGIILQRSMASTGGATVFSGRRWPTGIVHPDVLYVEKVERLIKWRRDMTPAEARAGYVHLWDRRGEYIAACSGLVTPDGQPDHKVGAEAAGSYAAGGVGVFRARIEWPYPLLPDPFSGSDWHMTPSVQLATELQLPFTVEEAWIYPGGDVKHGLNRFYTMHRDARKALEGAAAAGDTSAGLAQGVHKGCYGGASGWLRRGGVARDRYTLRPDIAYTMLASAKARRFRALFDLTGEQPRLAVTPFAMDHDGIITTSNSPDPTVAAGELRVSDRLGAWKHQGCLPMKDVGRHRTLGGLVAALKEAGRDA
jgi:hypothetical protein